PGPAPLVVEDICRCAQPSRQRRGGSIALPVVPHCIPKSVVPLCPAGREGSSLVSAWSDIPRFRNQFDRRQYGILAARLQESALIVKPVRLPRQNRPQVETESIDVRLLNPVAQAVGHHLENPALSHV